MSDLFERASRSQLSFSTSNGNIRVDDLWDLPLTSQRKISLNQVAKLLSAQIKAEGEEDFVGQGSPKSVKLELSMAIVKRVIEVRLEENKASTNAKVDQSHNAEIDELIKAKQFEEKSKMSVEELEKLRR